MDLRRIAAVLPCDGLGDFPVHLTEQDASAALHNWTAAWRPELIATAGRLPGVWSSYSPPDAESAQGCVLLVPEFSWTDDLSAWRTELSESNDDQTLLLDSLEHRDQILARLRAAGVGMTAGGDAWQADFFALGYAYLQVELLTHNLIYASVINTDHLEQKIVEAARAAVAANDEQVEQSLRSAYDMLEQVRDHSYPTKTYLIDLVLLGETTVGERLQRELAERSPKNFLMPPSFEQDLGDSPMRSQLAQRSIAATHEVGAHLSLSDPVRLSEQVDAGLRAVAALSGHAPAAFVQLEGGLAPRLPGEISKTDALALVVAPLSASAPEIGQSLTALETPSGQAVETLVARPRPASCATALLMHASRLGESLYQENVSTELFAAWAGCRHTLFEDLRRVAARSTVLGTFVTLEEYFAQTHGVESASLPPDDQLGPELAMPLSAPVGRASFASTTLRGVLDCAARLVGSGTDKVPTQQSPRAVAESLASVFAPERGPQECRLVMNPYSYARPVLLGDPQQGGGCDLVESGFAPEVPGLGYRVIGPEKADPPAAERATTECVSSEMLEVLLDPATGGLRSVRRAARRRNRLSQKLVVRRGSTLLEVPTRVEVESPEVLVSNADRGVVALSGRLFDLKGGLVACFRQTFALFANWNRLLIDIELDTESADTRLDQLRFASRVALPDSRWQWRRGVQWTRLATHTSRFVACDYAHVVCGEESLTLGGASAQLHVRHGARMLDSLLPEQLAGRRRYRIALAIDERRPLRVALDLLAQHAPAAAAPCQGSAGATGWIAHVDVANVQVAALTALPDDEPGARLTLVETDGRHTDARARFARRPRAAWWVDSAGRRAASLDTLGESLAVPLAPHDCRSFEVTW